MVTGIEESNCEYKTVYIPSIAHTIPLKKESFTLVRWSRLQSTWMHDSSCSHVLIEYKIYDLFCGLEWLGFGWKQWILSVAHYLEKYSFVFPKIKIRKLTWKFIWLHKIFTHLKQGWISCRFLVGKNVNYIGCTLRWCFKPIR